MEIGKKDKASSQPFARMDAGRGQELSECLLAWYDKNARDLPWRRDPVPYKVWISEIMLQQTRVEAGKPYFERFVAVLPDVRALAGVEEEALLKLWEGLGYYNRAKNLKKAAVQIMEKHGGSVPGELEALRELPGIGDYTAGAIGSIAFGLRVPAVDGNVLRVISRLLASRENVDDSAVKKKLGTVVTDMIPSGRPGDFNQALMELGATVCLPNGEPKCLLCPWEKQCAGHQEGIACQLPVRKEKKPRSVSAHTVVVAIAEGMVLLRKRGEKGLLSGLWQPLSFEGALDAKTVVLVLEKLGLQVSKMSSLGKAKHIFTHQEWKMEGYLAFCRSAAPVQNSNWISEEELSGLALPSAFKAYTGNLEIWLEDGKGSDILQAER